MVGSSTVKMIYDLGIYKKSQKCSTGQKAARISGARNKNALQTIHHFIWIMNCDRSIRNSNKKDQLINSLHQT